MRTLVLVVLVSGCAGRALDVPSDAAEQVTGPLSSTMTVRDAAGGDHVAQCGHALPDASAVNRALALAWDRALDMADAPRPTTEWQAGELGGGDVDADGNITVAWGGSFACSPQWVDELLLYRRYLMTGYLTYVYPSGTIDAEAARLDQAEGANARAALADAGL